MDKLQISQIIKELISQGYPEPIIGGTCSLFLQGFDIEPGDIDLYYSINKEDFLNQVHHRRCPKFSVSIDWNFYPNLDLGFQEINIEGVKLRVQKIEDVLNYKLEGLEEDYFPESKRDKHLRFFQELISDPRVSSDLKLRINQILNIMPKGYGKGPRKFEDLINQHPMDDKFVKSMEEDIKNDPNRKDELDFYKAIKGSDVFNCESGKVYNFIMKNGEKVRAFGKPMSDKRGKHTNVDMYSLWKCNGMNFGIIYDPWGGYAGAVGKKSDLKKIWEEASKTDKEWYDSLGSIKEYLFDAPEDVKVAFNSLVKYFDDKLPEKLSLSGIYHEWKGPMGLERQSASELSGYFKGIQDDTYKEYKDKSKNAIYSRFKTAVEFFKKSEGSQTGALADTLVGLVKAYNEK